MVKKIKDKTHKIKKIGKEIISLDKSPLYSYRKENGYQPVIGEGNINSRIVLIGEAPGKNEAETGKPFCGRAGQILDKLLESASIKRGDIYITNLVNDRPPKNRRPTRKETKIYAPYQIRQLKIIRPKLIVSLGKTATQALLIFSDQSKKYKKMGPFSNLVGQKMQISFEDLKVTLLPSYHPAYAIYKPSILPKIENIFKQIALFKD